MRLGMSDAEDLRASLSAECNGRLTRADGLESSL